MDNVEMFLKLHREKLLKYLDGKAPGTPGEPEALEYIEDVLTDWSRWSQNRKLDSPDKSERTFWFALYQLEELVEYPDVNPGPYEALLMQNLARVREHLRAGEALPDEFFATRPGEDYLGSL